MLADPFNGREIEINLTRRFTPQTPVQSFRAGQGWQSIFRKLSGWLPTRRLKSTEPVSNELYELTVTIRLGLRIVAERQSGTSRVALAGNGCESKGLP